MFTARLRGLCPRVNNLRLPKRTQVALVTYTSDTDRDTPSLRSRGTRNREKQLITQLLGNLTRFSEVRQVRSIEESCGPNIVSTNRQDSRLPQPQYGSALGWAPVQLTGRSHNTFNAAWFHPCST